jgi:hypothetical protein
MELVFATNHDDWEAIYIDGVKQDCGHSLRFRELATYFTKPITRVVQLYISTEYSYEYGDFPNKLEDLPKNAILETTVLVE